MLTLSLALWPLAFDGRGNVQLAAVGERCPVCNNDLSLSDVHSEELTRVFLCPAVRGKLRKVRAVVFQKSVSDLVRNLQDEPHPSVLVADLDADIGEDKNREGLLNTPERVAKSMVFLTAGYEMDPVAIINSAKFKEDYHDMVLIKDTEFYSMCEHHMLPFFGKVHVAYVPDGEIVGLSKIPRIIDVFARRLQVQERMTVQIRECIENTLHPKGVAVVVEAQHLCMQMRGVQKQGAVTRTMDVSGVFNEKDKLEEFLNAIS